MLFGLHLLSVPSCSDSVCRRRGARRGRRSESARCATKAARRAFSGATFAPLPLRAA